MRRIWGALGAMMFILGVASAGAGAAPTLPAWPPVKANDGVSYMTVAKARAYMVIAKSTPAGGEQQIMRARARMTRSGAVVRRSWVFNARHSLIGAGRPFALARGRTTVRFQVLVPAGRERIWSSQFDAYINVCINGSHRVWASGGRLYCEVDRPGRVKVTQTSRITKLRSPRLVGWEDLGPVNGECTLGELRDETGEVEECRETTLVGDEMFREPARRKYRTKVRVARLGGGTRQVAGVGVMVGRGARVPGWVRSPTSCSDLDRQVRAGEQLITPRPTSDLVHRCMTDAAGDATLVLVEERPLPAPAATVAKVTAIGNSRFVEVSITNHYRISCKVDLVLLDEHGGERARRNGVSAAPGTSAATVDWWETDPAYDASGSVVTIQLNAAGCR